MNGTEPSTGLFIWALGATLLAHCLSFISVTYFDQIIVIWYWLLAAIGLVISNSDRSFAAVGVMDEGLEEPHPVQVVEACESGQEAS